MALYVKQNEPRTQLSSKVTADLTQRLNKRSLENDDSKAAVLLQNQRKTTGGGLFWSIIVTALVVAAVAYVMFIC